MANFEIICPATVLPGCEYTKEKRQELYGQVAGGGGSKKPEEYQRLQIITGSGRPCDTTHMRINWRKNIMVESAQPMRNPDGFDYTENFDGKQTFGEKTVWVNLNNRLTLMEARLGFGEERFNAIDKKFDEVMIHLRRIEDKLDNKADR